MVWIMIHLGLPVDKHELCHVSAQSDADLSAIRVERIGIVPFFKGRNLADIRETFKCPLFQFYFNPENLPPHADRILTGHVQEALKKRFGEKVIPLSQIIEVYDRIPRDQYIDTPRTLAQKTGSALEANIIMVGAVWRFRERAGGALGVESPASVAFAVGLVDVVTGKVLWTRDFDQTQRSLSEDIRDVRGFFKRGAKWLTAEQLAGYGVDEIFRKFPF